MSTNRLGPVLEFTALVLTNDSKRSSKQKAALSSLIVPATKITNAYFSPVMGTMYVSVDGVDWRVNETEAQVRDMLDRASTFSIITAAKDL